MDLFRRMRRAPQSAPVNFPIREARMAFSRASNPESAPSSGPSPNGETQSQIRSATTSGHDTPADVPPVRHNPMLSLANTADILLRTGLDPDILMSALMVQRERDRQGVAEAPNTDPTQPSTPQAAEPDHTADEEDAAIDAPQPLPVAPPARDPYPEQTPQQYQPQQQHQYYQQPHQYYQQPHQYHQQPHQHHQQPPAAPNFRFYNPETRRAQLQPVPAPAPAPAPVIIDLTSPQHPAPERNHDETDLE